MIEYKAGNFGCKFAACTLLALAVFSSRHSRKISAEYEECLRPPRAVSCPSEKTFFGAPSKGEPAEILDTKSEILTVNYRENWDWSERVGLYNRQEMVTTKKGKSV